MGPGRDPGRRRRPGAAAVAGTSRGGLRQQLSTLLLLVLAVATPAWQHAQAYVLPSHQQRARAQGAVGMNLRSKVEGPGNHAGANLYVDRSCNGCGTCRAMCPGVFGSMGMKSAVQREPKDEVRARWRVQFNAAGSIIDAIHPFNPG